MNPALIILGVVIVLIIYLYFFYSTSESILSDKSDLTTQQPPILVANIVKPDSSIYSYEFWVYVGKYSGVTQKLFYRESDKSTSGTCVAGRSYVAPSGQVGQQGYTPEVTATSYSYPNITNNIGVYIDGASPTLKIDYVKNNAAVTVAGATMNVCPTKPANEKGTIVVTDNFPAQSWVHVIISVSNNYIDTYVNGKLTKSIKESDGIYLPSSSSPITFGRCDGTILAKLTRTTKATDPQTAWDKYSAGNGDSKLSKYLGTLGMDVSLKKDNIEYSKFNLF
jgi:hypothetical protein